jgi:hypothetical protein
MFFTVILTPGVIVAITIFDDCRQKLYNFIKPTFMVYIYLKIYILINYNIVPRSPTFKVLTVDPKKRERVESFHLVSISAISISDK